MILKIVAKAYQNALKTGDLKHISKALEYALEKPTKEIVIERAEAKTEVELTQEQIDRIVDHL